MNELPRYKSHKIVEAARITVISRDRNGNASLGIDMSGRVGSIWVSSAYVLKHAPKEGGYYVRYPDGYESWSPAGAFEEGYTLVDDQPLKPGIAYEAYGPDPVQGTADLGTKVWREDGSLRTVDKFELVDGPGAPLPAAQVPSVGRIVQFRCGTTRPIWQAAMIVEAVGEVVNLVAWDGDGSMSVHKSVLPGGGVYSWRWPPRV